MRSLVVSAGSRKSTKKTTTAKTRAEFAQQQSLTSIQDYLISARKIGVVDNRDDIILVPGEIEFLTNTFDTRAKIYPSGGHLGNLVPLISEHALNLQRFPDGAAKGGFWQKDLQIGRAHV